MGIESIYLQYTYDERTKGRRKEFYICIKGAKKKKFQQRSGMWREPRLYRNFIGCSGESRTRKENWKT